MGAGLAAGGQARYTNAQSDDAGGTSEREGDEQRAEDERCEQGVPLPASAPGHAGWSRPEMTDSGHARLVPAQILRLRGNGKTQPAAFGGILKTAVVLV